jgi:oligoendopeptidase F
MFNLPLTIEAFMEWPWLQIEPFFQALLERPVRANNMHGWLADWTRLIDLLSEMHARLNVAVTLDTTDKAAEARYHAFLDNIHQPAQAANQQLKEKLLASGLEPEGFELPLRKMRAEADLFRSKNLALLTEEPKIAAEYNRLVGMQSIDWEGEELTLQQLRKIQQNPDRPVREQVWRLAANRWLEDRQAINQLWVRCIELRGKLAKNAGMRDYRVYRWQQMLRLDYTPEDCVQFQQAIEQVAVPAATRLYEKYRQRLGVERLRPWDLDNDLLPLNFPPLPPYGKISDLEEKVEAIFDRLDPQLGEYFHTMRISGMLNLENRKGKAPGAYCTSYNAIRIPFIFMNAIGLHGDVRTIFHESGHAFHNFERYRLPYAQQRLTGMEFNEVASMAMELLADRFVSIEQGGFYSEGDARRFRATHLEQLLTFWPYMAVVDAFQHWVYTHHDLASSPANCDKKWLELWERYLPGIDWSGLEAEAMTGWQRKQHIFRYPFYYVEYGLAQMGAVQVWRNALKQPEKALRQYRYALSLGGTASLPELYAAAGAKFTFDSQTLKDAVELLERTIDELDGS